MFIEYVPSCSSVRYVKYFVDNVKLHRLDPYEIVTTYLKNNRIQVLELCYTLLSSGGTYDRDLARLLKIYKVNRIRILSFTTWIGIEDVEKSRKDAAFIIPTPLTELALEHVKMDLVDEYVNKMRLFVSRILTGIKKVNVNDIVELMREVCGSYVDDWDRDELHRIASTIVNVVRSYIKTGYILIVT